MNNMNPQSMMGNTGMPSMAQPLPGGVGGQGEPLCPMCGQCLPMPSTMGNGPQVGLPQQEMGLPGMGGNQPSPQSDATSALLMALLGGGGMGGGGVR